MYSSLNDGCMMSIMSNSIKVRDIFHWILIGFQMDIDIDTDPSISNDEKTQMSKSGLTSKYEK